MTINIKNLRLEYIYVIVALVFGLVLIFLVPPFQSPDEIVHYYKAAGIAQGEFVCPNGVLSIQQDRKNLPYQMSAPSIAFNYDVKFDRSLLSNYSDSGGNSNSEVDPLLCKSSFLGHLAPGLGILTGQLFGLNELQAFYIGRICSLMVAVALTAIAIRLIPFGKHLIFVLGVLPMTILLYGSFNYDAGILSAIFLFVAFTLYLLERKKPLKILELAALLVLAFIISSIKMGYQPLLLLVLLFFPKDFWKKRYYFWLFLAAVVVVMVVPTILFSISQQQYVPLEGVVASEQIKFILGHPFTYVKIFLSTMVHSSAFYLKSFIGVFGWLDYDLPLYSYVLVVVGGLAFIVLEKGKLVLSRVQRIVLFLSSFLSICLIFLALYIYSSPVGYWGILGIQGRYFIPVAMPLVLSLLGVDYMRYLKKYSRELIVVAVFVLLLVFLETFFATIARYY